MNAGIATVPSQVTEGVVMVHNELLVVAMAVRLHPVTVVVKVEVVKQEVDRVPLTL